MIRSFIADTFGIDPTNPIAARRVSVELDASDCIAVGSTLRMLARTAPCGDALDRVGTALVKAAVPKQPRVRGQGGVL